MIDIRQHEWPVDMRRAANFPEPGILEQAVGDVVEQVEGFARANPMGFGLCALGLGFVLGWRLKPW